jgi:hypothetical protein
MKETYNGWTNYETWRINLEIFDSYDEHTWKGYASEHDLAESLRYYVEQLIADLGNGPNLAVDYALAFISEVNWHEIAQHMREEFKEDEEESEES